MTGVTIDHLVATTAFIAAIFVFTGLFTQTLQAAILYQQNRHVALKASDLLDNILLSPGYPYTWSDPDGTNETLSCFGLQKPGVSGYVLSSFALTRLLSAFGSTVYYNITGEWYSNISWGFGGGYLLIPVSESVDYTTASRLLGVNGSYGFQLSVAPTVKVSISEIQLDPLKLKVKVEGPGFPLKEAALHYNLFWVYGKDPEDGTPLFNHVSGSTTTNMTGSVLLDFSAAPYVDGSKAYTVLVDVHLSGLSGVGYKSRETITSAGNIIPFVESFEDGSILLAHKWGKNDPDGNQGALHFNATYFTLSDDFEPNKVNIPNSTGLVNYGKGGKPYHRIEIPTLGSGFLVVSYTKGNEYGMVIMPWGISILGFSVLFGESPVDNVWTATDLRQVTVDQVAYQAKITCWSLQGYQIWNPGGWF
jgi:hypothetical protein